MSDLTDPTAVAEGIPATPSGRHLWHVVADMENYIHELEQGFYPLEREVITKLITEYKHLKQKFEDMIHAVAGHV